jgi:hypothetical protein
MESVKLYLLQIFFILLHAKPLAGTYNLISVLK